MTVGCPGSRVEIGANLTAQSILLDDQSSNLVVDTSGTTPVVLPGSHSLGFSSIKRR